MAKPPTSAEVKTATPRHRESGRGYATSVRYREELDSFELSLRNGVTVLVPRALTEGVKTATTSDVTSDPLDVDVSVPESFGLRKTRPNPARRRAEGGVAVPSKPDIRR